MKNISWCPCLKVRVNFIPRRNYAAHFTVAYNLEFNNPWPSFHWCFRVFIVTCVVYDCVLWWLTMWESKYMREFLLTASYNLYLLTCELLEGCTVRSIWCNSICVQMLRGTVLLYCYHQTYRTHEARGSRADCAVASFVCSNVSIVEIDYKD